MQRVTLQTWMWVDKFVFSLSVICATFSSSKSSGIVIFCFLIHGWKPFTYHCIVINVYVKINWIYFENHDEVVLALSLYLHKLNRYIISSQNRENFPPFLIAAALKIFFVTWKNTEEFQHHVSLFVLIMICSKGQRALRSGNQKDHPDRCFEKVFSVKGLGKSDCFCIRHYEKIRESNETKCCFPLSLASDNCSRRLIKCPNA